MTPQIQKLIGEAIECFQNGLASKAEEILLQVLRADKSNLVALEIISFIKSSQGNVQEAENYLGQILNIHPENAPALRLIGVLVGQKKQWYLALDYFNKSLKSDSNNPATYSNIGNVLLELERYEEAISNYDKAIALEPTYAEAWSNKGNALSELKRFEEAISNYDKAIALEPTYAEAWSNKGNAFSKLKFFDEALISYEKAVTLSPQYAQAWANMGGALQELKSYEKALHAYQQALSLNPQDSENWSCIGNTLSELKQYEEALAAFDKAILLNSLHAEAWSNKSNVFSRLGRHQEALNSCQNAIEIDPTYALGWSNQAVHLIALHRYTEALDSANQALSIEPNDAGSWLSKGFSLHELLLPDHAIACYEKAIAIDPTYIDGYWNKSFSELILGQFDEGWKNYEYRWLRKDADQRLHANIPALPSLTDLQGKKILVWSEQGFGDTLQFARYIPKLAALGAIVTFEVQAPLAALFKDQYSCSLISKGDPIGELDFQIPLLSLPLLFKTNLESIPADIPYIQIARTKVQEWGGKLALSQEKLNIGIACSGNIHFDLKNGNKRPIPLESFSKLSDEHNLFLIQKEIRDTDQIALQGLNNIHQLGEHIETFEDTAAIIEHMDLIISIDTSLAHLAGALGKKVFILLPWCPDWRWLATGIHSPWYPTATLFRQSSIHGWGSVMDEVGAMTSTIVKASSSSP